MCDLTKPYTFSHEVSAFIYIYNVCSDVPNAFWHRKKHIVDLPYVKDFFH